MMDRPQNIIIPQLHAGLSALISWDSVISATSYQLERQLDTDMFFVPIYSGANNNFNDTIPFIATTATYRVQALGEVVEYTWDELEAFNRTWNDWDALNWQWAGTASEFTVSETKEVIPNRPPVISGQDSDLGYKFRGFNVSFSATDPDPESTLDLQVKLDNAIIFSMPNAQQGAQYTVSVTDEQIFAMEDESEHSIIITATDNWGESSTRTHTFTVSEDLSVTAVFYVLRDGIPIAKLGTARQWTDYMEVGTHRYIVRGVDRYGNFSDSNEVTVTIALNHPVLGLVSDPGNFVNLIWRMDEKPTIGRNYDTKFSETWYEGRIFPVYEHSGQKIDSKPLAFSTLTLIDQQNLFRLIAASEPLIYRDHYESRMIGVVPNFSSEFDGRYLNDTHDAIININMTLNRADFNEVIEYD